MKRRVLTVAGLLLTLTLCGPTALAKVAPSQAVIDGPSLGFPVPLRDAGERTLGPQLLAMVDLSGFSDQLFATDDVSDLRPTPLLGPRYTVRYTLPHHRDVLKQYVFPFAAVGPVTHMPEQRLLAGTTEGGWYVGGRHLSRLLEGFGIRPPDVPTPAVLGDTPTAKRTLTPIFYASIVVLVAAAFLVLRRPAR